VAPDSQAAAARRQELDGGRLGQVDLRRDQPGGIGSAAGRRTESELRIEIGCQLNVPAERETGRWFPRVARLAHARDHGGDGLLVQKTGDLPAGEDPGGAL